MVQKALKASLALPVRIAVLPVRLSMFAFNKVFRKEFATTSADIQSPFKTVPRHPLHSSWFLRSALMASTGQHQSFESVSYLKYGQGRSIDELDQGSWKPFLPKVFNTKVVGLERRSCDRYPPEKTSSNSPNSKQMSKCLRDSPLKQFPSPHLGPAFISRHSAPFFIPFRNAKFRYRIYKLERFRPSSANIDKSSAFQLNSAPSRKDKCGCKSAELLSKEWHKLLAMLVILTRVAHLLFYLAWAKHLLRRIFLQPELTRSSFLSLQSSRATPTGFSESEPEVSTVSAHLQCANSGKDNENEKQINEVCPIFSNPGRNDGIGKDVPEKANNIGSHQGNGETSDSGRKRKPGKRRKGKRKSEYNDVAKRTVGSSIEARNNRVESSLEKVSQNIQDGLSEYLNGNLKAIKNCAVNNSKDGPATSGPKSSVYKAGTAASGAKSANRNTVVDKIECVSKTRPGRHKFIDYNKALSKRGTSEDPTPCVPKTASPEVTVTPDIKRHISVRDLSSSPSS